MNNIFTTPLHPLTLLLTLTLGAYTPIAFASGAHDDHDHTPKDTSHEKFLFNESSDNHYDHGDHDEHESDVEITDSIAEKSGIKTAISAPALIKETTTVYGRTVLDVSKVSHIQARFEGLITKVYVNIGDTVKKGQPLVEIESNEGLNRYTIKAPFAGLIEERHANPGEIAREASLLTLIDEHAIIAQMKVFPAQRSLIKLGQATTVSADGLSLESTIDHFIHSDDEPNVLIARLSLFHATENWIPGMLVKGLVTLSETHVDVAVDDRAIQTLDGQSVVFVKTAHKYEARHVKLGKTDGAFTQVIEGLTAGETYVVENSYLIKADLEKSGAAHVH